MHPFEAFHPYRGTYCTLEVPSISGKHSIFCPRAGFQAEVLLRINALRAAGAVCGTAVYPAAPALNWNNLLQQAASGHSSEMRH
jgi:uncharacterized protein YkwD